MRKGNDMEGTWSIVGDHKLLCNLGEGKIWYRAGTVFFQEKEEKKLQKIHTLPVPWWKKIMFRIRLLERMLRLEPRLALPLSDTTFLLSYQGKLFRMDTTGSCQLEHEYRTGMNNPLCFCRYGQKVLYGEYFGNGNQEEVCIYERREQGNWERRYAFPGGSILHIHQIVYDKFRNCFWILTGDSDHQSGIWRADISFLHVTPLFLGKQIYRSCFLMPMEQGIAYATDTPLESNGIYFAREKEVGMWGEPELVYDMPGPCIYGTSFPDGTYAMATSVEPDASLLPYRYWLTKRLGKGVKDRYTHVIMGNVQSGFCEIARFKKDHWRMLLFQFGNLQFPETGEGDAVLCTGQSLKKIDGKTVRITRN